MSQPEDFGDINVDREREIAEYEDREWVDFDDEDENDGQPDDLTELSDFEQADEYFTGGVVHDDPYPPEHDF